MLERGAEFEVRTDGEDGFEQHGQAGPLLVLLPPRLLPLLRVLGPVLVHDHHGLIGVRIG
ncbi:hypothetical protein [Streptomyces sp. NPDC058527]|uniref:hypothetical protein n=1 Tax=unclassified Streptomyces TaxID=2593676 RepID=UPI003662A07D